MPQPLSSKDPATGVPADVNPACPAHVVQAIYGTFDKAKANEESLKRWWHEYADRKNDDETEDYIADSLLYDRNHLPRSAPAPDCIPRAAPTGTRRGDEEARALDPQQE